MLSSTIVLEPGPLERFVEIAGNNGMFFYDTETVPSEPGLDDRGVPARNRVMWLGMITDGAIVKVPMGHPIGTDVIGTAYEPRVGSDGKTRNFKVPVYSAPPAQMSIAEVFDIVNPLFADPDVMQSAHGETFDDATVAKYRRSESGRVLVPAGKSACTIEMHHLVDENVLRYGLKYVSKDKYGFTYDDAGVGKCVEKYRLNDVARYLHYDLVMGFLEHKRLRPMIESQGLTELWEIEMALTTVLADMRTSGVAMDEARLEALRAELSVLTEQKEREFYHVAGRKVNLRSPIQLQSLLYKPVSEGGQGLKPWKMTKSGKAKAEGAKASGRVIEIDHTFYSTDDESLEDFKESNPVVKALVDYRETSKVYSTYVLGYLGDPNDKDKPNRVFDGRVYPDFVQYGTVTGRFSCRDPNLQNIPRPTGSDDDLSTMIRGLFIAPPGHKLIVADYSQIELVLLAHFIGHGMHYDGFLQGIDPHTMTAAMALDLDPQELQEKVNANDKTAKRQRQDFGKSINFATVYGAWLNKLASMMKVSFDQAKSFKATFDANTPEIEEYRSTLLREARRHSTRKTGFPPHIRTILGRVRRLPELMASSQKLRNRAERQIFNSKVQGSSADLTKLAMVRFYSAKKDSWRLVLTVHDELVVEAPEDEAEEARAVLVWAMTGDGIQDLVSIPLKVDVHVVDRWSSAK